MRSQTPTRDDVQACEQETSGADDRGKRNRVARWGSAMPSNNRRRFLILVKTYPVPSASNFEIVCTAGMDTETNRLARLFPLPFRTMDEARHFKKWDWVEANVTPGRDGRPDSFRVDATTIRVVGHEAAGANWSRRMRLVEHLIAPSYETLAKQQEENGTSLGLIKPAEYDLVFEDVPNATWSADELDKLAGATGAVDLFGTRTRPRNLLEKMPVRISYKYKCKSSACRGHTQFFEDWEVCEAYRSWRARYPNEEVLREKLREKFVLQPRAKDNLHLFIGTTARFQKTWIVIGQMRPELKPS